jgi:hypothetical protein
VIKKVRINIKLYQLRFGEEKTSNFLSMGTVVKIELHFAKNAILKHFFASKMLRKDCKKMHFLTAYQYLVPGKEKGKF